MSTFRVVIDIETVDSGGSMLLNNIEEMMDPERTPGSSNLQDSLADYLGTELSLLLHGMARAEVSDIEQTS